MTRSTADSTSLAILSRAIGLAALTAVTASAALAQTHVQTQAATADVRAVPVANYTVFVDPPTGFVFVKLPQRWAFAGKLQAQDVAHLPSHVVTSLLARDDRLASAVPEATRAR